MARIRTIKPEFPQSESMGRVSREARLCFIMMWTIADDSGRLRGHSRALASLLYPFDDDAAEHIDGWLTELEREGCIRRYQVDGASYAEIAKWLSHQKIDRPSPSKLPAFEEASRIIAKDREPSPTDLGPVSGPSTGTKNSVADATSADAPEASDLKALLFSGCLQWFIPRGPKNAATARRIIGQWISRHGEGATLQAFMAAQRTSAVDPIAYITKVLNGNAKPVSPHKADADAAAEAIAFFQAQKREVAEDGFGYAGPDQPALGRAGGVEETAALGRDRGQGGDDDAALLHAGKLPVDPSGAIH